MVAKMRIRKDILKDSSKCNVRWMYKQTLWDADIFPKDSITRLRGFNNNTLDVVELLGLKPKQQHQDNSTNANVNKGANTKHPYKKQRTDFNTIQNKAYTEQNHNKKQGQNNQKTVTYNNNNPGNAKQNNNNFQTKKQSTKNKKAFQKKN